MQRVLLIAALVTVLTSSSAAPTVYTVRPDGSGDFPTIQEAVDAAINGDVIELTNGIFSGEGNRDIDYGGKAITVRSQSGDPELCVLLPEGSEIAPHRGFFFHSGEGGGSVLEGVAVIGGWGPYGEDGYQEGGAVSCEDFSSPSFVRCKFEFNAAYLGGGVYCVDWSSPSFTDCVIANNSASVGAGVYCRTSSSPSFTGCVISGNEASARVGGIALISQCSPLIVGCTISGNHSPIEGGALGCTYGSSPHLRGCTLVNNSSPIGGGLELRWDCIATLENVIIAFGSEGEAVYGLYGSDAFLTCCDVYGNAGGDYVSIISDQAGIEGNISEDPLFCGMASGDYTLQEDSPCAPFTPPNEECDLIGAWPVGCGPTPITKSSWGEIKALFR